MKKIVVHDKIFEKTVPHREIVQSIRSVARKMNERWRNTERPPVFLAVLNGAFMFAGELLRHIEFDCEIHFVKLSSYQGTESGPAVSRLIGLDRPVEGREVVVLEDIVETGNTVQMLDELLRGLSPASVRYASMFFKPAAYGKNIPIEYYAMELPNDFIIGFGLDYDGLGRNLKDIYTLVKDKKKND